MVLQNPFNFLVRDSDVEGMSDGWDNATAYGGCRGAHGWQLCSVCCGEGLLPGHAGLVQKAW